MDPARPGTPQSPLTNSLYRASSTIDDLTAALTDFSRVPSPEPPSSLTCCCGREDCQNLAAWLNLKSRLESRLIFSAGMCFLVVIPCYLWLIGTWTEVGQALLQRHEAYVRKFEVGIRPQYTIYIPLTLEERRTGLVGFKLVTNRANLWTTHSTSRSQLS